MRGAKKEGRDMGWKESKGKSCQERKRMGVR
jgi:hypothetical protein